MSACASVSRCEQLGLRRARVVVAHEHADVAHVVVAQERGQLVGVRVGVGEPVVLREALAQRVGRPRRGERARLLLEGEVEHRLAAPGGREARQERVRVLLRDLAEGEEAGLAGVVGGLQDVRQELLPELEVDVLHRVDAEAVDVEVLDPRVVDALHARDDRVVLREQVVEAEEVAVEGVLARERRVAAVVVERDVVEPVRLLGRLTGRDDGRVRERAPPGPAAGTSASRRTCGRRTPCRSRPCTARPTWRCSRTGSPRTG